MATTNSTTNTAQTSAYSYLQYKNKIGGLVSGMDIDSLMEKLMKAESAQMEKLQQQKTKYEWKRDAYREVNTKLSTFEQSSFTDYGLKSSWNTKSVTVSNDAVSATATSAANGTLNIEAAKLSTAGSKMTTLGNGKGIDSTITLATSLGLTEGEAGEFSVQVNGETKKISYKASDTLESFVSKLEASGGFKINFSGSTDEDTKVSIAAKDADVKVADTNSSTFIQNKLGLNIVDEKISTDSIKENVVASLKSYGSINDKSTMADLGITGDNNSFKIKAINDKGEYTEKTITYKATDKLEDVMSRINSSGVGVTAIVSNDKLSLVANTEGTGKEGAINISSDDNGLFKKLGVLKDSYTGNVTSTANDGKEGTSGFIQVNGVKIEGKSNSYLVSGYQLNINKEFNVNNDGTVNTSSSSTKITSTTDTDAIVDKVKKFVDSYNELIADLNKRTTEKKNTSYPPLTDAQKAEMKPEEITKWEEKAKAGLLKGDSTLNNVLSSMRSTLSTYGNGTSDMLYSLGISTSSSYSDNGKLVIDEDKLKEALSSDPDKVARIFAGDSSTGAEGIISKMRTTIKDAVATIKNTAGSSDSTSDVTYSIGKNITSLNSKIDDWKDRLKGIEERYWNQFSAMEKAIQKANSQTSIFDSY